MCLPRRGTFIPACLCQIVLMGALLLPRTRRIAALKQQASVSRPKLPAVSVDLLEDLIQDQGARDLAAGMAGELSRYGGIIELAFPPRDDT
jgi:hypothetical protein